MSTNTTVWRAVIVVALSWACTQAHAGVVITGTRLIYPAAQSEITVKLNNNGAHPALVQAWIDSGSIESSPTNSKAPFVLSPPVSRIDPDKGQSLRLMFTGAPLPADKESVFWLNVLEIPPKQEQDSDANILQMAFRSRIKIFYRPESLKGQPADAARQLQWRVTPNSQGKGYALQAYNPTEFHVSQVELVLLDGKRKQHSTDGMIGPGETKEFPLIGDAVKPGPGSQVEFNSINDYGALIPTTHSVF